MNKALPLWNSVYWKTRNWENKLSDMLSSYLRRAAKGGLELYQHAQRGSLAHLETVKNFMQRASRATEGLKLKSKAIKLAV